MLSITELSRQAPQKDSLAGQISVARSGALRGREADGHKRTSPVGVPVLADTACPGPGPPRLPPSCLPLRGDAGSMVGAADRLRRSAGPPLTRWPRLGQSGVR